MGSSLKIVCVIVYEDVTLRCRGDIVESIVQRVATRALAQIPILDLESYGIITN